jgi:hypothetical protein
LVLRTVEPAVMAGKLPRASAQIHPAGRATHIKEGSFAVPSFFFGERFHQRGVAAGDRRGVSADHNFIDECEQKVLGEGQIYRQPARRIMLSVSMPLK